MKTWLEIVVEIILTVGLADWVAGFVHWFEDAYVREDTPLIGAFIGKPKSRSENSKGSCFRGKGGMAMRDERAYPCWVCKRGATPPDRPCPENPPGGGAFGGGPRWLGPYSPLAGCAGLAALATTKIPSRRTPFNFQTGSNILHHHLPRYFTRFSWWHSSRDLLLISGLIVLAAWGLGLLTWQVWLFAFVSTNANEIHKWSHRTRKENGRVIGFLQDLRVLQTPQHHAIHHTNSKNCHCCPITNLVNPMLDRIRFWDALEGLLARTVRLHRRPDTSLPNGQVPAWVEELRREAELKKPAVETAVKSRCQCINCPRKTSREIPCLVWQRMKPAPTT